MYSIALRHGLDVNHLAEMNRITDPRELRVGQELYLQPLAAPGLAAQQESLPHNLHFSQYPNLRLWGQSINCLMFLRMGEGIRIFQNRAKGVLLPYSNSARDQLNNQSRIMPDQKLAEKILILIRPVVLNQQV